MDQAANGGTILSTILSLPIACMGLVMSVIIMGAIPPGQEGYCDKVGYAHLWAGVSTGAAGVAGGLAIGMTRKPNASFVLSISWLYP